MRVQWGAEIDDPAHGRESTKHDACNGKASEEFTSPLEEAKKPVKPL